MNQEIIKNKMRRIIRNKYNEESDSDDQEPEGCCYYLKGRSCSRKEEVKIVRKIVHQENEKTN